MRKLNDALVFSPSDLIKYLASPFSSWMDRYYLENPSMITPDKETEEQVLIAQTGDAHEKAFLDSLLTAREEIAEINSGDLTAAVAATKLAIKQRVKVVYQAALEKDQFAGLADFLMLDDDGAYQLWDTKLARSPKPYYAVQLCCYAEMYAATTGEAIPERFGIILGTGERVSFRTEDFFHFYRAVKKSFLQLQETFTNDLGDRPEPLAGADHGRWTSYAEKYFLDTDHLTQVAGITTGQIKKLKKAGIASMRQLSLSTGQQVPKLAADILAKLCAQAKLQCGTREDRRVNPDAPARFELIDKPSTHLVWGLENLPSRNPADVFFDMEGYPLALGGLEYLFGATTYEHDFMDWWGHNREEEKAAFEGFVDWVHKRWQQNPDMHIYHYAAYEESALRRLSIRHDTRQEEVDDLLRNDVLVDLYKIIRQGIRVGEDSYSIKAIEHLYRPKRSTTVATAVDSIVQYARWLESGQTTNPIESTILKSIRDYNEDDCRSTEELLHWLRSIAFANNIASIPKIKKAENEEQVTASDELTERLRIAAELRAKGTPVASVLGDLIDFHRREQKPGWWRMFDRAEAEAEELCDDPACIYGINALGAPQTDKLSQIQHYAFNGDQECKLEEGKSVMFCHDLEAKLTISSLDLSAGRLSLKIGNKKLNERFGGRFPGFGSLVINDYVSAKEIQAALASVGKDYLSNQLSPTISTLLERRPPATPLQQIDENVAQAAIRVANAMHDECLIIQGPPGTGKTYTASKMIVSLLAAGKKVGVASNSHKAVMNLLCECGNIMRLEGKVLRGIKAGGDNDSSLFTDNPAFQHIASGKTAAENYTNGLIGGTAWLFSRPEMVNTLDFLFIDEAGQVSLANAVAMARSASNLVLLGDQMQLEQPIQGRHPGDSGMSALQYALKDEELSLPDAPVYHAVVPVDYGIFLGESRRMHPAVCQFISDSIYEGRLGSYLDCERQKIETDVSSGMVNVESGVVFIGVEHDGNIQQSEEEAQSVLALYRELLGKPYTDAKGQTRALSLDDFLFISPYNSQVTALRSVLPTGARVGSVDKFQGQEAPVCILSMCSSFGEYGSRGLGFILDKNRVNVAISRAKCLAIVVADPRISQTPVSSMNEMRLLNLFCKLAFR